MIAALLLIVASLLALNAEFIRAAHSESGDDIFGAGLDPLWIGMVLSYTFPYTATLAVVIYNGLYSLKSTRFTIAKCLHYIAFGINLATILLYIFIYAVWNEWLDFLPKKVYHALCFSEPVFFSTLIALCVSIVLGTLGTILHKRDKKRQLKSADS